MPEPRDPEQTPSMPVKAYGFFTKPVYIDEGGHLARLWRLLITKNGLEGHLEMMVQSYINNGGKTLNDKQKDKSAYLNELKAPSLTWRKLLDFITTILKAKKVTITLNVQLENGRELLSTISIDGVSADDTEIFEPGSVNVEGVNNGQ